MNNSTPQTAMGVAPPFSSLIGVDTRDSLCLLANRLSLLIALDSIGELAGDAEIGLHDALVELKKVLAYETCRLDAVKQADTGDAVTVSQAMDALLKICDSKDSLYPLARNLEPGVETGLKAGLDVIGVNYEVVHDFIAQFDDQQKEVQS